MWGALEGLLKSGNVYDIDANSINHDTESISG